MTTMIHFGYLRARHQFGATDHPSVSNYIWMRLIWKITLWIFYLYRVSRMRLELHPTHPDLTGGIGFISEAQGRFALFILAYGISNVAARCAAFAKGYNGTGYAANNYHAKIALAHARYS